ncbi:conserved protein, unknown function [Plasmodium knowlesi strain H]|uniref:Uncharacterized protein n=1 Tax=Plasmodium knowlesi (strain H) TaxID=5851 RepID=A0A1A7VEM6_PLAKH|nr:conserved protein, unknown function [Plasmodium knowlesi strain H]SBO20400.1 conserved protein, unknown function [Plasmodium knowlesi strain H]
MKETEISIENFAYAKMFMHGLKNSYDDVCGILIGKYYDVEKKKQKCVITDSIPLFHTHILSPFLNLAFTLVSSIRICSMRGRQRGPPLGTFTVSCTQCCSRYLRAPLCPLSVYCYSLCTCIVIPFVRVLLLLEAVGECCFLFVAVSDVQTDHRIRRTSISAIITIVVLIPFHLLMISLPHPLIQVENHYKGKEERILGYYHISTEDSKNEDIQSIKVCELIANKLVKNYSDAIICLVQLSKLERDDANCLNVFMQDDATEEWKNCDVKVTRNNKDFLKMSLSNNKYLNLHDFDDHLNCINHDFMNPNLFNNIQEGV